MAAPKVKKDLPVENSKPQESISPTASKNEAPAVRGAYPIAVRIFKVEGQPPQSGQIVKLVDIGFLMKVSDLYLYKVGESYQVQFDLPDAAAPIQVNAKVIKTYDSLEVTAKTRVKMLIVEMHFKDLASKDRTQVHSYLVKTGQAK